MLSRMTEHKLIPFFSHHRLAEIASHGLTAYFAAGSAKMNETKTYRLRLPKVRIDYLIPYAAEYQLELYLRLSEEKFVKVSQKGDNFESILDKYKNRGVTEIYLTLSDYDYFITSVRKAVAARLTAEVTAPNKAPEISLLAGPTRC